MSLDKLRKYAFVFVLPFVWWSTFSFSQLASSQQRDDLSLVPVSLQASRSANYSIDPLGNFLPPTSIDIIKDSLREHNMQAEDLDEAFNDIVSQVNEDVDKENIVDRDEDEEDNEAIRSSSGSGGTQDSGSSGNNGNGNGNNDGTETSGNNGNGVGGGNENNNGNGNDGDNGGGNDGNNGNGYGKDKEKDKDNKKDKEKGLLESLITLL